MALWIEDLVVKNKYSRPGLKLLGVKGIVMHWTATPGASDENEQKYFDGSDGGGGRYASAHLFVDSDSARLIVPLSEVAYHANEKTCKVKKLAATASYYSGGGANLTSIGIEMCVEKDSTIHEKTVKRCVEIAAEICEKYKLDPLEDIYRHYDITGKNCPAPWVTDSSKFTKFKKDVKAKMEENKKPSPSIVYEAHVQGIGWQGKVKDGKTAGTTGKSKRLEALTVKLENTDAELEMEAHVQSLGWTTVRANGEVIGTIGESLRLEAVKIKAKGLTVQYRVHVEKDGWTAWKKDGETAGTTGQAKRIEAIQIKLG